MEFIKKPSIQIFLLIIAILLGVFLTYREYLYWRDYKAVQKNVEFLDHQISLIQKDFNKGLDRFDEKEQQFNKTFEAKIQAFTDRYEAMFNRKTETENNTEEEAQQAYINRLKCDFHNTIIEIFDYESRDTNNHSTEERYQFLHIKIHHLKETVEKLKERNAFYEE